jgi:hypothetical protein
VTMWANIFLPRAPRWMKYGRHFISSNRFDEHASLSEVKG